MIAYRRRRKNYKKRPLRRRNFRRAYRRYAKKSVSPYNSNSVRLRGSPFPQKLLTKLCYNDYFTATIATNIVPLNHYVQIFQSSLYDPDKTNLGHQPLYYDQICPALYTTYSVYGVAYRIEIQNTNTEQAMYGALYTGSLPDAIIGAGQWTRLAEQPGIRNFNVHNKYGMKVIKGYMSVAKALGISRNEVRYNSGFQANSNANPALMAYMHLYLTSMNSSATNYANIRVRLTFYCEFNGLVSQSNS